MGTLPTIVIGTFIVVGAFISCLIFYVLFTELNDFRATRKSMNERRDRENKAMKVALGRLDRELNQHVIARRMETTWKRNDRP